MRLTQHCACGCVLGFILSVCSRRLVEVLLCAPTTSVTSIINSNRGCAQISLPTSLEVSLSLALKPALSDPDD
jgi:hypothetical protein